MHISYQLYPTQNPEILNPFGVNRSGQCLVEETFPPVSFTLT